MEVRSVDGNGTLELVCANDATCEQVAEALGGSDWEDTWAESTVGEDGLVHMLFDKADQAAILRLLNAKHFDLKRVHA